ARAAYRQARQTLVAELGIEPGERLRELHGQMLAQDTAIAGDRPAARLTTAPREERKVVTVLFADLADLADFRATAEQLDPEDVRAILRPYYARIRSEVERFGGRVETFIGDAMMALFGARLAHEDDPERAVRAALAIRDWLAEQKAPRPVRIAVATGEAHVAFGGVEHDKEPVAVGDVLNMAARLQVAAPQNGVLVDEQTVHAT